MNSTRIHFLKLNKVVCLNFFKDFIQKYSETLPKAIVLDFGIIKGEGWALIEANPAWCSGLYACDAEKVLEVIVESCVKNL